MSISEDSRQKQLKKFGKKLPEEWRSAQLAADSKEVYKTITNTAINNVQLAIAKEMDEDLKALKEQVKVASAQYTEGTKLNNVKIEFLVDVLRSRGEDVPDPEVFLRKAANGELKDEE